VLNRTQPDNISYLLNWVTSFCPVRCTLFAVRRLTKQSQLSHFQKKIKGRQSSMRKTKPNGHSNHEKQNKPNFSLWPSVSLCGKKCKTNPNIRVFSQKSKIAKKQSQIGWHLQAPACGCFLQNKAKRQAQPVVPDSDPGSSFYQTNPKRGRSVPASLSITPAQRDVQTFALLVRHSLVRRRMPFAFLLTSKTGQCSADFLA
jgi:hypothetical protein